MKITVTFDKLEEFQTYMGLQAPSGPGQELPKTTGPKKTAKTQAPVEGDLREDAPAPGTPKVTEDFRVEVRKALAQLNKKVGKNIASELIKGFGVDKLTEVALADLPALMDRAKEALNAG